MNSKLGIGFSREVRNQPIGVMDSGIGGLSVVEEIMRLLPQEPIVYLADRKNFPYGEKTVEELKQIAVENVEWMLERKVKLVVVACNTLTVNAIGHLRYKFPGVELVAMEPAVKPALGVSRRGIAVLSSPKTVESGQVERLAGRYGGEVPVYNLGSLDLVRAVEEEWGRLRIEEVLKRDLPGSILKKIDVLVLGCTHFPLVREEIKTYVGEGIKVLDSGKAVARRVKERLMTRHLLGEGKSEYKYLTTGEARKWRGYVLLPLVERS